MAERSAPDPTRKCPWCSEQVRIRNDGRLSVHLWQVDWDREKDKAIMGRCVGSGATTMSAIAAGWRPEPSDFPRTVADVGDDDVVQVLMERRMVRVFERRCLPVAARLVGPLEFGEDELPTFLIAVGGETPA